MAIAEVKSQKETWGTRMRNVGLIAAIIGLVTEYASLGIGGLGLAVSGAIFRRSAKKPQPKLA